MSYIIGGRKTTLPGWFFVNHRYEKDYFFEVNWISLFRQEINDYPDQHIPDQARIELHLIILKNTSYIRRCVFI